MAVVKNDNWIRRFEVTDPKKHKNGFTVYKVTSVVFPKIAPEAATSVAVWKRYNDFKKLYKSLKHYHKQWNIDEELPQICKGKYFKRFKENIIKDRIEFALELLNFIGRHQILFTCDPFIQFFNNGYQVSESVNSNTDICGNECLTLASGLPQELSAPGAPRNILGEKSQDSAMSSDAMLINSEWSDEDDTFTSDTSGSMSPTHSSVFCSKREINSTDKCNSNSLNISVDMTEEQMNQFHGNSVIRNNQSNPESHPAVILSGLSDSFNLSLSEPSKNIYNSETCPASTVTLSCTGNYLVEAAYLVGQAQTHEANGEFEAAFSFYKSALACLSDGVQDDDDRIRREAVREKANQYLQRAEKIYSLHLADETEEPPKKIIDWMGELKIYKVLGVLHSVMLVINMIDDKLYVIKVLQKSPCPVDARRKTTIPYNVPYMVKLYKYLENENSIFLILEYAEGGRLWDSLINSSISLSKVTTKSKQNNGVPSPSALISQFAFLNTNQRHEPRTPTNLNSVSININNYFTDNSDCESASPINLPEAFEQSLIEYEKSCQSISDTNKFRNFNKEDLEIVEMLENSQKLLNSVNKTLRKSEKITSNLNKELNYMETVFDLKCRLLSTDVKNRKKRSKSAGFRSRIEKSYSSEDLTDLRPRTASSSIDRRDEWARLGLSPFRISETVIRGWAAEIFVALETLHRWGIVCRDLHPGNILLDERGNILLSYHASWEGVDSILSEEAVSGLYAAPENMSVFPVSPSADWWSFGALLHELLTGKTLLSCYPEGILSHTVLTFPESLTPDACSLLKELLKYEPGERLGGGVNGAEDIKCHPFFNSVDWQLLYDNFY